MYPFANKFLNNINVKLNPLIPKKAFHIIYKIWCISAWICARYRYTKAFSRIFFRYLEKQNYEI